MDYINALEQMEEKIQKLFNQAVESRDAAQNTVAATKALLAEITQMKLAYLKQKG